MVSDAEIVRLAEMWRESEQRMVDAGYLMPRHLGVPGDGRRLSGADVDAVAEAVVKKLEQRKAKVGEDAWHYPGQPASFHTEIG